MFRCEFLYGCIRVWRVPLKPDLNEAVLLRDRFVRTNVEIHPGVVFSQMRGKLYAAAGEIVPSGRPRTVVAVVIDCACACFDFDPAFRLDMQFPHAKFPWSDQIDFVVAGIGKRYPAAQPVFNLTNVVDDQLRTAAFILRPAQALQQNPREK